MAVSQNLRRLIETNAPLWAGEAEIVRTYWTSPVRNRETDKLWLKRQCWKEYAGVADSQGKTMGMVSDLEVQLRELVPRLDIDLDRHDLRELLEKVYVEYTHYCLFADIYDSLRDPGEPKLNANKLETWPEEEALASLRRDMRKNLGKLGMRASNFTEGGYCTMYSEGAKLKGRPGVDGRIGRACQKVYDDELGHMMAGVIGIDDEPMSERDWAEMTDLTMQQLRLRLDMRNAEFSHPVPESRIKEIIAGKIEPIAFDYAKAEEYLRADHAAVE
ncbi:MAG TPA: hypothetical protein VFA22_00945 [Stellaceae bacterium]|nr:hypothetical protein [Stellaceae bacterium]